jgi:hypothetical protein
MTRIDRLLRRFFEGDASVATLARRFAAEGLDHAKGVTFMPPEGELFLVRLEHLVKLCDAVLAGQLQASALRDVGFILIGTDILTFDSEDVGGERIAEVVAAWSAPEINWPLTVANVAQWRHYLLTGAPPDLKAG